MSFKKLILLLAITLAIFSIKNTYAQIAPGEITLIGTSPGVNITGTALGSSPDNVLPSFWDIIVTNSIITTIPDGTYDAYCLSEHITFNFATLHYADAYASDDIPAYTTASSFSVDPQVIARVNWLVSQNVTSDAKYSGQYNYGELQGAIWQIQGVPFATYYSGIQADFLTGNGSHVVLESDINFLVAQSLLAVTSGANVKPIDSNSLMLLDVARTSDNVNSHALVLQLESAKVGDYVWLDQDTDGAQDAGEIGINGVTVNLYDSGGALIATTTTGDDFGTAVVETGFYQFTGLKAADYSIKVDLSTTTGLTPAEVLALQPTYDEDDGATLTPLSLLETAFTITATPGENHDTATFGFYIKANEPPVIINDTYTVDEDNTLNVPSNPSSILNNDSDVDGVGAFDGLTVESLISGPSHGTLLGWAANGSFVYEPSLNYNGQDTIIFNVCDGGTPKLCAVDTVFITIDPVNDPPSNSATSLFLGSNAKNQIITFNTLTYVTDVLDPLGNMDPATVKITEAPTNGTISIDPLTGIITYTPNPGFLGFDSFRYEACDDGNPLPSLCQLGFIGMTFIKDTDGDLVPDTWDSDANNDGIVDRDFITCANLLVDDVDFAPAAINGNLTATMTHDAGYYNATITSTNPTISAYNAGFPRYVDNLSNVVITRSGGSGASTTIVFDKPSFNQQITVGGIKLNESQRVEFFYQGKKILLVPNFGGAGTFHSDTIATTGASANFSFTTSTPIDSMIVTSIGTADDIFINIDGDACVVLDDDGDGIFNHLDLDLDGDGIYNVVENGALDEPGVKDDNHDGMIDGVPNDFGSNGLFNGIQSDSGFNPTVTFAYTNSDTDGIINYLDLDSDGDGIPDNVEGQSTVGYIEPSGNDTDNNGVDDDYDTNGNWIDPVNTDNDPDGADYIDTDSDNDGIKDTAEVALVLTNNDNDNDGLDDITDTTVGYADPNGIIDTPSLLPDMDGNVNSGGDVDYREILDSDNDGIANNADLDDDNDGILDYQEGCGELIINGSFERDDFTNTTVYSGPFAGANGVFIGATYNADSLSGWSYTQNLDGWVEGGNWAAAYDGIQYIDIIGNNNVTGGVSNELTQVINTIPGNSYVFSFYWGEDVGHSIPEIVNFNASVIDSNNIIILNESLSKNAVGSNGAGIRGPNDWFYFDKTFVATTTQTTIKFTATPPGAGDTSAGAALDFVSVVPASFTDCRDTDNDSIPDAFDLDSDGDGIYDVVEAGNVNLDGDHDGIIDGLPADFGANGLHTSIESDDTEYATINYTITNTDADSILNYLDLDSDGDGVPDNVEGQVTVGYLEPSGNDTDGNGVDDAYDTNGNWIDPVNTDGVDEVDYLDTDSDNDGLDDTTEVVLVLSNSDGDNDGLDDAADTTVGYGDPNANINTPSLLADIDSDVLSGGDVDYRDDVDDRPDTDNDGIVDAIDIDDDNDGVLDKTETDACSGSYISFLEDFGQGDRTDTPYTNNYCYEDGTGVNCPAGGWLTPGDIGDGEYAILNDIGASASWAPGAWTSQTDHTGDTNGRMALFNASYEPGEFYNRTFTGLFQNTAVRFSFWILNVDKITLSNNRILPNITVQIQDKDGNLLYNFNTGNIAKDETWHNYTTTFNPGNNTEIKLILINNAPGGGGNDLALDDISIIQQFCDTDNDGISNHLDLDSDNDGIYDVVENGVLNESGVTDDNNDGIIDGSSADFGANGLFSGIQSDDTPAATINYTVFDTDSDGTMDAQELDADADGCNDVLEASYTDDDFDGLLGDAPISIDNLGLVTSATDGYTNPTETTSGVFDFQDFSLTLGCSLTAVNDTLNMGTTTLFIDGNVLDNDVANYTDILIVNTTPITVPTNGSVVLNADGSFTYTPNGGFVGQDSFVYEVCDDLDPKQCDIATVLIVITQLEISEGFSPNGDNINDFWYIKGINGYPLNKVQVFNRWGNMVYQASGYNNIDKRWEGLSTEGAFLGKKVLPEGTYFFVLDLGDGSKVRKGFITLKK